MIDFEEFREGVWGMTGRPDVPLAPYLTSTLADICRSGVYPEDVITIYYELCGDAFTELPHPAYHRLSGWRIAGFSAPPPRGLSFRRIHSGTLEYHTDSDNWGNEPLTLLSSTQPHELNRLMRECGGKPAITYAAGHAQLLVPAANWREISKDERSPVSLSMTMLTSNESRGWNWASDYGNATGSQGGNWAEGEPEDVTPSPVVDEEYIWQIESCLDLVTLGTAAGVLRFAGQEKEGLQMYQEFLLGIRQYSRDRADDLVEAQNALGY